jgi:hypothetical protein
VALNLARTTSAPPSAAARAFQLQLTRIDKLKGQLQELDALAHSHRLAVHQQVKPLITRRDQCTRNMALLLDASLEGNSLSRLQRQTATEILCGMAAALAEQGDADMALLHDKHSRQSLAALKQIESNELRAQLEAALGERLDGLPEGASVDDMLAAGMARMRQTMQADQERRRTAAARRKAKKKPSAAQTTAHAQLEDAETSLRKLFRQLASTLHPDREPDAQIRLSKTAWMSEANAAYERRDLMALLQIQQKVLGIDALAAGQTSDDKLAGLTQLLKQQVADLERERAKRSEGLAAEFELAPGFKLSAPVLQARLQAQVSELEQELALMHRDLAQVQDDAGLKRWLNGQREIYR